MDMLEELFSCIAKNIIDRTNFGHQRNEKNSTIVHDIVDIRKAKYLFTRMDLHGIGVDQRRSDHIHTYARMHLRTSRNDKKN